MEKTVRSLQRFNLVLLNDLITLKTIDLLKDYRLSHKLALPDSLIAATVLITDFELFTYNVKDFRFIPQLKIFDP